MMSSFNDEDVAPPPGDHVIFTDLDGVEGVLVDLDTKQYYQLNETASLIWRGIAKGKPIAAIANEIVDAYDVSPERALSCVAETIGAFADYRLLRTR